MSPERAGSLAEPGARAGRCPPACLAAGPEPLPAPTAPPVRGLSRRGPVWYEWGAETRETRRFLQHLAVQAENPPLRVPQGSWDFSPARKTSESR